MNANITVCVYILGIGKVEYSVYIHVSYTRDANEKYLNNFWKFINTKFGYHLCKSAS